MAVGTRNAAAAKKAAPAAASFDEPDLLAGLEDSSPAKVDPEEVIDLLDGLSEDNGTPWLPDDEDDPSPAGIQGRVSFVGSIGSDYGPEEIPLIELDSADGTVWSIRGYATALRNQIAKADPKVGDLFAAKYFGVKTSKANKQYKDYKVIVRPS